MATRGFDEDDLHVPHRGLPARNFVLYPLRDIAPTLLVPGHGRVERPGDARGIRMVSRPIT